MNDGIYLPEETASQDDQRQYSACFSGHRMKNMDIGSVMLRVVRSMLYRMIEDAAERGFYRFYTGMADGVDLWGAEAVIALRNRFPALELHCVYPFRNFQAGSEGELRYQKMMVESAANSVHYIARNYQKGCFSRRNQYMVDHSSLLIAVLVHPNSGTGQTVRMAERAGIEQAVLDLGQTNFSAPGAAEKIIL